MKIIRNGQEIELTSEEMRQAYEEKQREYYIDDIGNQVREVYEIEPCTNNSNIDFTESTLKNFAEYEITDIENLCVFKWGSAGLSA